MNGNKVKIIFFGTPDFAVSSLSAILDAGIDVAAVVTTPDKEAGRGQKVTQSAVKRFAVERGLRILQPERLKDGSFVSTLREIDADLFVVIAFRMLPEVVWGMPRLGTFNLHASLLPKYRGAAPINRAVMNGETKTGVTTFFLQHEIDTGDIIDRVEIDVMPEDNAGDVHDRLMNIGASLTVKTIKAIEDGTLTTTPQADLIGQGIESCPAPKIYKETGNIDWTAPAGTIHNLVRGLSPYPGAWSMLICENASPREVKIFKTAVSSASSSGKPGSVRLDGNRLFVATGDRDIEVMEIQAAGKKRMSVDAFLRGARLNEARFEKR